MTSKKIEDDFEGFGIVYLEANLAGKPVIAGDSGGVRDAVHDNLNGLLVIPDNLKAQVLTVSGLADILNASQSNLNKTIIVISAPQVIEKLLKLGVAINKINVGGIHYKEGRSKYLSYLYLAPEEIASLIRIMNMGISVDCQDVPDAKKIPLQNLI